MNLANQDGIIPRGDTWAVVRYNIFQCLLPIGFSFLYSLLF